jgi:hypothetical protein
MPSEINSSQTIPEIGRAEMLKGLGDNFCLSKLLENNNQARKIQIGTLSKIFFISFVILKKIHWF